MGSKSEFINKATGYLGSNYQHFCNAFWGGCFAWCAAFVSVVGKETGVDIPWSASCTSQRTVWKQRGRWHTDKNIQIGDVVYYDWDKSGDCDHVGIVTNIDSNGTLQVTEGNFGDYASSVTRVTNRYIKPTYPYLCGYGRPVFDADDVQPPAPEDVTIYAQIKVGVVGEITRVAQAMLLLNGCNPGELDGDFGNNTRNAVIEYQRKMYLDVDGIIGPKTWGSLKSKTQLPQVRMGDRGTAVILLQSILELSGFNPKGVDGIFGSWTRSAVEKYQKSRKLDVDGIVGPKTWGALMNE